MPKKKKKGSAKIKLSKIHLTIIFLLLIASGIFFIHLLQTSNNKPVILENITPIKPFVLPSEGALLGVSLLYSDANELEVLEEKLGKRFAIVGMYQSWGNENAQFNPHWARQIANQSSIPMITWEPWEPVSGYDRSEEKVMQETYLLKNITEGNFDQYINEYATVVAGYRKPVIIRFAHEMNGNWYPWGSKFNTPDEYIAAWRHVHSIFESKGAENVIWLWSPNAIYKDDLVSYSDNLGAFYPGDKYVDWVGFSAFNWAGIYKNNIWKGPEVLLTPTVTYLKRFNKPIIIAETASADSSNPADKAQWIKDLDTYISANSAVRGVIWFNTNDNGIYWNLDSTQSSIEATKESFGDYFIKVISK